MFLHLSKPFPLLNSLFHSIVFLDFGIYNFFDSLLMFVVYLSGFVLKQNRTIKYGWFSFWHTFLHLNS